MADLYASFTDMRTVEILRQEYLLSLQDRNVIQNHPALVYLGDLAGTSSTTVKLSQFATLGADLLDAVADGANVATTAMVDASYTCTIGRRSKKYEHSDLAKLTDTMGSLDAATFAADAVLSGGLTLTSLIAGLVGGFSNDFGTTTANLTIQQFEDAATYLELTNVQGPYMAVLHGRQWGDLRDAVRTATGTLQWIPASADMISSRGAGFKGSLWGVDVFVSNHVPTANAGADRAGGMFGTGAILHADGSIMPGPATIGSSLGKVLLEWERSATGGLTAAVVHMNVGAVEGDDTRGASLITDA